MSYIELRYYRSYALEVREFGDTGWAIHVYAPDQGLGQHKITVITTTMVSGLKDALAAARSTVDHMTKDLPPD